MPYARPGKSSTEHRGRSGSRLGLKHSRSEVSGGSGPVEKPTPPKVKPLAPQRYALQVTIEQSTHGKLRHAQALLGRQLPSGDVAQVLDRALDALIGQLEKRKFAATKRPSPHPQRST